VLASLRPAVSAPTRAVKRSVRRLPWGSCATLQQARPSRTFAAGARISRSPAGGRAQIVASSAVARLTVRASMRKGTT
jgi:hypothetical protein